MNLLRTAIEARIPVIQATCNDVVHLQVLLKAYSGGLTVAPMPVMDSGGFNESTLYFSVGSFNTRGKKYEELFKILQMKDCSYVVVNLDQELSSAFNVGEIPVEEEVLVSSLEEVLPKIIVQEVSKVVKGLSISQAHYLISLTSAKCGGVSLSEMMRLKHYLVGFVRGLELVSSSLGLYVPSSGLKEWVSTNKKYFLSDNQHPLLVPRGLLLIGIPGVGKTRGAMFIAEQLGVPLYRLSIGSVLDKYHGVSEHQLEQCLNTIDKEEPCVILLDEVEKIFNTKDDSGVGSRMLSILLWWLAEHTSRVITVMTANNFDVIPPELYREGRIDATITLHPLKGDALIVFAMQVLKQFVKKVEVHEHGLRSIFGEKTYSHSKIVQIVKKYVKTKELC